MTSPSPSRGGNQWSVLFVVAFVVLVPVLSFGSASAMYIAQNTAGSDSGADCADAHSAGWFNSGANWGGNSSQIGPGTTVHLCGTFTGSLNSNILTFHGSGTSGNPITLFWESGAGLTSPACGMQSSACINVGGHSYIVIDGNGSIPSITQTDNGSPSGGYGNQVDSNAIYASPCNNCEMKNLTITNMYVHTDPADTSGSSCGVSINGSNYAIHDNSFDQMLVSVDDPYQDGDNNLQIYNNSFDHMNWGVHIGNNSTSRLNNVFLGNNHIQNMNNWDTNNDSYHHDGLFVVQNNTSAQITNVFFYNNLADGDLGNNATAWFYWNTGMNGVYAFNNVLKNTNARPGYMMEGGYSGDQNFFILNNYVDCNGGSGFNFSNVSGFAIENNTMSNCHTFMMMNNLTNPTVDHNVYAVTSNGNSAFKWNNNAGDTFAQYRAKNPTLDPNTLTPASAGADSNGIPQAGSPMIHDGTSHFANLSSSCTGNLVLLCSDRSGGQRPNTGNWNWDAGAYMYGSSQIPAPPTGLAAVVH